MLLHEVIGEVCIDSSNQSFRAVAHPNINDIRANVLLTCRSECMTQIVLRNFFVLHNAFKHAIYGYIDQVNRVVVLDARYLGTDVKFTDSDGRVYTVEAGMSTLLHEVFHDLENTKSGDKLKKSLAEYAREQNVNTGIVDEIKEAYKEDGTETIESELAARQLENLLLNERVINAFTQDNSTLAKRILNKVTRLFNALKGEKLAETESLERILNKTIKLYNKAIAQKGKGQTVKPKKLDKKEKQEYNKTIEGGEANVERSDEFRRIQEESLGLSDEDVRMFHRGGRSLDAGIRERLSRVFRRELESECRRAGYDKAPLVNKSDNLPFAIYGNVDADMFHDIFNVVHQYLKNGDAVDVHDRQYYRECRNYLTEDGLGGFSITKDGDLISVFNLGQKGFLGSIRDYVREQGAVSLDCYQSNTQALAEIYEHTLGFYRARNHGRDAAIGEGFRY